VAGQTGRFRIICLTSRGSHRVMRRLSGRRDRRWRQRFHSISIKTRGEGEEDVRSVSISSEKERDTERERKTNLVARRGIRLSIVVLIDKAKADKHNRTCKNPNITRLLTFRLLQSLCFDHYYPSFAFLQRLHRLAQDPLFHVVARLSQADVLSVNEVYPRHWFDCSPTSR
jgi:hypothetical protein